MNIYQMGVIESRFADIIWENEPISSTELSKCGEEMLGWKKFTTYTVLKRLCDKGIFQNAEYEYNGKLDCACCHCSTPAAEKAPKWIIVLMWGLVGIRLVCPFSLESAFSLIPSAETVPGDILHTNTPAIHSGVEAFNSVVNSIISDSLVPAIGASVNPIQVIAFAASAIWIAGIVAMFI